MLYNVFASAGSMSKIQEGGGSAREACVIYSKSLFLAQPWHPDVVRNRTTSSFGRLFRMVADSLDCIVQVLPLPSFNCVS